MVREQVPEQLHALGTRLLDGLRQLESRHPAVVREAAGVPELCFLRFNSETLGALVARVAAGRGLLWKRSAYNFVSLAHTPEAVDRGLELLDAACAEVGRTAV
jgi:acetylornithine/succinyldiaminopimelate/putrescine aminotransferase